MPNRRSLLSALGGSVLTTGCLSGSDETEGAYSADVDLSEFVLTAEDLDGYSLIETDDLVAAGRGYKRLFKTFSPVAGDGSHDIGSGAAIYGSEQKAQEPVDRYTSRESGGEVDRTTVDGHEVVVWDGALDVQYLGRESNLYYFVSGEWDSEDEVRDLTPLMRTMLADIPELTGPASTT